MFCCAAASAGCPVGFFEGSPSALAAVAPPSNRANTTPRRPAYYQSYSIVILELYQNYIRVILELDQSYIRAIVELYQSHLRVILELYQSYSLVIYIYIYIYIYIELLYKLLYIYIYFFLFNKDSYIQEFLTSLYIRFMQIHTQDLKNPYIYRSFYNIPYIGVV